MAVKLVMLHDSCIDCCLRSTLYTFTWLLAAPSSGRSGVRSLIGTMIVIIISAKSALSLLAAVLTARIEPVTAVFFGC